MAVIWGYSPFAPTTGGSGTPSPTLVPIQTVSSNTTLDASDGIVLVNAAGGAVTITLPAAADFAGQGFVIKKIDSSQNEVTIDAPDNLDGDDGRILKSQASVDVVSNGTTWFIL